VTAPGGALARLNRRLTALLGAVGLAVPGRGLVERLLAGSGPGPCPPPPPPAGADEALRHDHPRLVELRSRYRGHPATNGSVWNERYVRREVDLRQFRGDNAYVWQRRRHSCAAAYALTAGYVERHDPLGLLETLGEDGVFGAHVYDVDGVRVSRDLLDSVLEITFLEEELALSQMDAPVIVDIGAGYGRLAHRMLTAFDHVRYLCTDAVPESTFLCEYYLAFRGLGAAEVLPLDHVQEGLAGRQVALAVNIHSFVECPLAATAWWLDVLAAHRVPYLMVVSSHDHLLSRERSGARRPLQSLVESSGYELVRRRPKFAQSTTVQEVGVFPAHYFLFRRRDAAA
jgi:hypothetical protein